MTRELQKPQEKVKPFSRQPSQERAKKDASKSCS